jgi:phage recombination protein Bet
MSADPKVPPSDDNKLSKQLADRGVEPSTWNTLKNSCFPGAANASILMAIDYCKARRLDVIKKPCHIVPMEVKVGKDEYVWRDVILPGIYEYRTTAQRTGLYLGHTKPEYGPEKGDDNDVKAPEYCDMTFFRWNEKAAVQVAYPVRVYFREVVGLKKDGSVNTRWSKAPIQMLTKCTEAAGLREAFPDEIGGEPTMEEMIGQVVDEVPRGQQQPQGTRTEQAKANLQRSLTDQKGTGRLDLPLNKGTDAEVVMNSSFEGSPGDGMPKASSTRQSAGTTAAQQTELNKQGAPEKKAPQFKYDIPTALAELRKQTTVAGLKKAYEAIEDDHEFSGRELSIDIEALYRDIRETLQEREAIQAENKHE